MTLSQSVPALTGWRPHDPHEWARQLTGLSLATRGALSSLADSLWVSQPGPCAVLDDDREIAAACGARVEWQQDARLREEVRSVLEPHPALPGMLTWGWLLRLWQRQLEAHQARRRAGAKGGKRKTPAPVVAEQQELPIPEPSLSAAVNGSIEHQPAEHDFESPVAEDASEPQHAASVESPEEPKQCLAMLSNARQSKSKRELLFSAPRREKQFSLPSTRADVALSGAPPAFVASDARGAPDPSVDRPPNTPFDLAAERAARERERIAAEEAEYFARRRRTVGATPTSISTVDWRSYLEPVATAVGVG